MTEATGPLPTPSDRVTEWNCLCGKALQVPREMAGSGIECPWCGAPTPSEVLPSENVPTSKSSIPPRGLWGPFLVFLGILAAVAGVRALILWNPFGLNQGAEVPYRVLFPDSFRFSRADACERTRRVLVSRAFGTGVDAEGRIEGSDRVVLRVLLERREQLDEILPILGRHAGFGLYPAAPRDVQAQFNRDGVVPEGYRSMENVQPDQRQIGGEYAVWDVERILVATEAVVNAGHVWSARAESQNWGMGPVWVTSFQLDMEGSKRFDAAAGELYRRAPRGMIAIVMDGRIHSTPAVQAEAFGGTGQVSGAASREEAEALSIVLRSGELPAPIGRVRAGKPEPGEPEGIEWFGFDEGAGP